MENNLKPVGSTVGVVRWTVAIAVLGAGLFYAWLASFAFGAYYLTDIGAERPREQATALVLASGAGCGAVATFRALTEKRVSSPWLLAGLVPSVIGPLNHLGIIQ